VKGWGEKEGAEGKGGGSGKEGEMTQTLYAHMTKRKKIIFIFQFSLKFAHMLFLDS
jgi:hypothetical protein